MSAFAILDLVIGLIFIYFLLSLACSAIQEIISSFVRLRPKVLNQWLLDTFQKGGIGEAILKHKLIDGLTAKGRMAAYIPSDKFSRALLDIIHHRQFGDKPYTIDTLRQAIAATDLLDEDFKRTLLQSIAEASGEITKVRREIEAWFDQAMERVSGTYKKKAQAMILRISIILSFALNVDSIDLSKYLYENPAARQSLADRAEAITHDSTYIELVNKAREAKQDSLHPWKNADEAIQQVKTNVQQLKALKSELDASALPLGWQSAKPVHNFGGWVVKILGILFTALAVSLGAPFWFDMLNKLVNLRSVGKKPESVTKPENT
ncbi:hypothetical protein [Ohtaekwangia koreensis]|uniref:Uncharacterized protein n=1 Tax=Ohtaekwangia koreensis TaxID=688867 RepID=A0A1T5L760_9BACT|nr:hypothetical protein [Ohtaekwangia koreensis]SKC71811.1 hypothetical protein SAMN05660236_2670 [Ohtaekwangia koreensis]